MPNTPTYEALAKSVLQIAAAGGMPDTFWATDSRIRLACQTLGWETDEAREWAYNEVDWQPEDQSASDIKMLKQYRLMAAETFYEDCGLYVWEQDRFKDVTELAKHDSDPDNPQRLI